MDGEGERPVDPLLVRTLDQVPPPLESLAVTDVTPDGFLVKWFPPKVEGFIESYLLTISSQRFCSALALVG